MNHLILILGLLSLVTWADNFEEIPADEENNIIEITKLVEQQVIAVAEKEGHAFRDAHRKHHGCVRAEFEVLPQLEDQLKVGVFAKPQTYSAWIRYSNGSGENQDDKKGDGRGMAIKLMGVEGQKLESDEKMTQDFLMINHPVFFVRNASEYLIFQQRVVEGSAWKFFLSPKRIFHELLIAKSIQGKAMYNPLESRYFSMTASKLGDDNQVKYSAKPCTKNIIIPSDSENRISENLRAQLANGDACYEFQIQIRTDKESMPVEDPTIEWSEQVSPFVTVAKIKIPKQKPVMGEFCETLSYNPWHGLEEHRPLGGISRVRRDVYRSISKLRHQINAQDLIEPSK